MEQPLTPAEFAERMRQLYPYPKEADSPERADWSEWSRRGYDPENSHIEADELMKGLLTALGYGEGCKIFDSASVWYS